MYEEAPDGDNDAIDPERRPWDFSGAVNILLSTRPQQWPAGLPTEVL